MAALTGNVALAGTILGSQAIAHLSAKALTNPPPARLAEQKKLIGKAVRIRPQEAVAAAASFKGETLTFPQVDALAKALEAKLSTPA